MGYLCEGLKRKNDYCCYMINSTLCKGCPYFDKQWKYKIKENQNSYCILFETKSMKECQGARFDKEKGGYECDYLKGDYGNVIKYAKCPYKTPDETFYDYIARLK